MSKSTLQLTREYLSNAGWACHTVEKWNGFAKIRQDCFGFADILAYHLTEGIALVQTTDSTSFSKRRAKIEANPHASKWKRSGGRIFLHGWGDKGLREEEL